MRPLIFLGRSKKADVNISTVGVDVCDWIYPKKSDFGFGRTDNRPSIKFSTWDFGGQVRERIKPHPPPNVENQAFLGGGVGWELKSFDQSSTGIFYRTPNT